MEADDDLSPAVIAQTAAPRVGARVSPQTGLAEFYKEHYRALLRFVMYIGANKQEAEDAVNNAMLPLVKGWQEVSNPLPYARRAMFNSFVQARQKERRRAGILATQPAPAPRSDASGLTVWEDKQWVAQMLRSLPERQREVMALVVDGIAPKDIAELLGRSPEAVRQNLLEARKRLKVMLGNDDHEAGSALRKEVR